MSKLHKIFESFLTAGNTRENLSERSLQRRFFAVYCSQTADGRAHELFFSRRRTAWTTRFAEDEQNAKFSSPVSNTKGIYWMPDDSWIAGYFTDLKEAIQSVIDNVADVFEHCYNYAVIEGYEEGFYPVAELTKWFKYDAKSDKAFEIEPPLHNNVRGYAF